MIKIQLSTDLRWNPAQFCQMSANKQFLTNPHSLPIFTKDYCSWNFGENSNFFENSATQVAVMVVFEPQKHFESAAADWPWNLAARGRSSDSQALAGHWIAPSEPKVDIAISRKLYLIFESLMELNLKLEWLERVSTNLGPQIFPTHSHTPFQRQLQFH